MNDQRYVECCTHGKQVATYVCQHILQTLRDNKPRGFWSAEAGPDELHPDSWCSECEAMVNAVGEWNDETEAKAGISMICSACYERARALNQAPKMPSNPAVERDAGHNRLFSEPTASRGAPHFYVRYADAAQPNFTTPR